MLCDTNSYERKDKNAAKYHPRTDDTLPVHGYSLAYLYHEERRLASQ